jgi:phage shock protein E
MKYGIATVIVVLAVIGGIFLMGKPAQNNTTQNNTTENSTDTQQSLSIQTIESDVSAGGQLLDVRTVEEFQEGHISGATNLPLQSIEAGGLPVAQKDKTVYVYCRSGNRSAQAADLLKKAGYQNVVDLGAMTEVQTLGGQVTK